MVESKKIRVLRAVTEATYELGRLSKLLEENPNCEIDASAQGTVRLVTRIHSSAAAAAELCDSLRPGGIVRPTNAIGAIRGD